MRKARIVLLEAVIVAAVGLVFALVANALSPHGLRLSRNYFPSGAVVPPVVQPSTNSTPGTIPVAQDAFEATLRRLEQHGLQPLAGNGVGELFHDQRYEQGVVVFIDARDDAHYQAGHIPGAWQFDHYHPEQYLPAILPVCLNAQKIVVYCTGGDCEDSEFAAIMLREAGVPRENLFVYAGGITEWRTNAQPIETGARGSGVLAKSKP